MVVSRYLLPAINQKPGSGYVYYVADTEANLPSSGLTQGDLGYAQDTDTLWTALNATTWKLVGPGSGGLDVGCSVYNSVLQDILDSTATALDFNSERYDTDGMHDNVTNKTRITFKTAGKYLVVGCAVWSPDSVAGERIGQILLNGATSIGQQSWDTNQASRTRMEIARVYQFAVNDYVEFYVSQTSGGNLDIESTGDVSPEFMAQKIDKGG